MEKLNIDTNEISRPERVERIILLVPLHIRVLVIIQLNLPIVMATLHVLHTPPLFSSFLPQIPTAQFSHILPPQFQRVHRFLRQGVFFP